MKPKKSVSQLLKAAFGVNLQPLATTPTGVERIATERRRQIEAEGYDAKHDEAYPARVFFEAAAAYTMVAIDRRNAHMVLDLFWPKEWDIKYFKPSDGTLRNAEKAGALMAAGIDRLLAEREAVGK